MVDGCRVSEWEPDLPPPARECRQRRYRASPARDLEGVPVSTIEDIQRAQRDVEQLQWGLAKLASALQEAEKVALIGEEVKRRAPVVVLAVAGVAAVAAVTVVIVRRRRAAPGEVDATEG